MLHSVYSIGKFSKCIYISIHTDIGSGFTRTGFFVQEWKISVSLFHDFLLFVFIRYFPINVLYVMVLVIAQFNKKSLTQITATLSY